MSALWVVASLFWCSCCAVLCNLFFFRNVSAEGVRVMSFMSLVFTFVFSFGGVKLMGLRM